MKKVVSFILMTAIILSFASCKNKAENANSHDTSYETGSPAQTETTPSTETMPIKDEENGMTTITITVAGSMFSAKPYGNETARALVAQLPITINMSELNGNEKYYNLADNLPSVSTEKPAIMNARDIMCWAGNCLVLFYKIFLIHMLSILSSVCENKLERTFLL